MRTLLAVTLVALAAGCRPNHDKALEDAAPLCARAEMVPAFDQSLKRVVCIDEGGNPYPLPRE